jgi:hypothetical protein
MVVSLEMKPISEESSTIHRQLLFAKASWPQGVVSGDRVAFGASFACLEPEFQWVGPVLNGH